MRKKLYAICLIPCFILTGFCLAQSGDTAVSILSITGNGFRFSATTPPGWKVEETGEAQNKQVMAVTLRNRNTATQNDLLIEVEKFTKQDEKLGKDLDFDISDIRDKYKKISQEELPVFHKSYLCYSKLVYLPGNFYQYIVYVNPGAKYSDAFSVTMKITGRPANAEELDIFKQIIASLDLI